MILLSGIFCYTVVSEWMYIMYPLTSRIEYNNIAWNPIWVSAYIVYKDKAEWAKSVYA